MQLKINLGLPARILAVAALAMTVFACDRIGQDPQAESGATPPSAPAPTKATPHNVIPPGGPYASNSDQKVAAEVRTALNSASAIDGNDISVTAVSGKVLLSGAVPQQQIARAGQLAKSVDGVKNVDNRLLATG